MLRIIRNQSQETQDENYQIRRRKTSYVYCKVFNKIEKRQKSSI